MGGLEDYLTKCGSSPVPCPNKCKVDHSQLLRKSLKDHLETKCPNRAYSCEHCGLRGKYASIVGEHDGECEKKLVPCPNGECDLTMERGEMKEHIETVSKFTEVACRYHSIGCNVRWRRMWMNQHEEEDDKVHLHLSIEMILKQDSKLALSLEKVGKIDYTLSSQMDKTAKLDSTVSSQMDKTAKLDSTLSSQMEKTAKLDSTLSSQLDKTAKLDSTVSSIKIDNHMFGLITFKYLIMERREKKNIRFCSKSFCTSPSGYKMCIRVYSNGEGKGEGSHVSVFLELLEGPNDESLNWPFWGTVKIELLNQVADDGHHVETFTTDTTMNIQVGSTRGYPTFFPHSKLSQDSAKNTLYLMDDTLYFTVTVENPKPWLVCTHPST